MGKPIVATDADGLVDILTAGEDALIVPKRNAGALADAIVWALDHPGERARLGAAARLSGRRYDVDLFVRKMERLYTLLYETSRVGGRRGAPGADLSFLTAGTLS
jgi:glycosyltransferase involved in cell wall biosynthesis